MPLYRARDREIQSLVIRRWAAGRADSDVGISSLAIPDRATSGTAQCSKKVKLQVFDSYLKGGNILQSNGATCLANFSICFIAKLGVSSP